MPQKHYYSPNKSVSQKMQNTTDFFSHFQGNEINKTPKKRHKTLIVTLKLTSENLRAIKEAVRKNFFLTSSLGWFVLGHWLSPKNTMSFWKNLSIHMLHISEDKHLHHARTTKQQTHLLSVFVYFLFLESGGLLCPEQLEFMPSRLTPCLIFCLRLLFFPYISCQFYI